MAYEALEALNKKITERQAAIIASIRESVRIPSVRGEAAPGAPYGPGPKAALEHALNLARRLGLRTGCSGDRVGWAEYGDGEEMAAVLGHLDVVPAGEGWTHPPFGGEIHDGVLYGRGVVDDKGPTIGAIYGLAAIRDLGLPIGRRIRVLFGTDEECGCSCVAHYIQAGEEMPAIGFTPDAEYPFIFFEKGISQFTLGGRVQDAGDGRVLSLTGGEAANVVTPRCTLKLRGDFPAQAAPGLTLRREGDTTLLEAVGRSAHGSTPEKGDNAAVRLFAALSAADFGGDFQRLADFVRERLAGETDGRKLGVYYADEETGETTVNLGLISYDGETCSFTLDIRYPKNCDPQAVSRQVQAAAEAYGFSVLEEKRLPMLYVPKDSELARKLTSVYRAYTGDAAPPLAIGGGTYAKAFPNMAAFGPVFPGEPEVIHQPDERADIGRLLESVRMTAAAMYEIACK